MTRSAYIWGLNSHNQVGAGNKKSAKLKQILPLRVNALKDVSDISCGGYFTLLLTGDGRVFSFGKGQYGRLGRGNEEDFTEPGEVVIEDTVVKISAGAWHSTVLTGGALYIWGYGKVM